LTAPVELSADVILEDLVIGLTETTMTLKVTQGKFAAIGFDSQVMDETYAVIVDADGQYIEDRLLGSRARGIDLAPSTITSAKTADGVTTVSVLLKTVNVDGNSDLSQLGLGFDIIWSCGYDIRAGEVPPHGEGRGTMELILREQEARIAALSPAARPAAGLAALAALFGLEPSSRPLAFALAALAALSPAHAHNWPHSPSRVRVLDSDAANVVIPCVPRTLDKPSLVIGQGTCCGASRRTHPVQARGSRCHGPRATDPERTGSCPTPPNCGRACTTSTPPSC
jgi:hypothetical protein